MSNNEFYKNMEIILTFMFGNKYKDWLATPIELIEDTNGYSLYLPSAYVEDIKYLCNDLVC